MQWLVAALLSGLVQIAGTILGRALLALGFSLVSYTGFSALADWLKGQVLASIVALPPEVVGMLSVLKVGVCLNVIFSAFAARLVINGLQGDTIKKWVTK